MTDTTVVPAQGTRAVDAGVLDALVVGTGFAGLYILHQLRNELGLNARAIERGAGVGGTWFWNRYPGALSDTESHVYRYSFDKELLEDWNWSNKYLNQPDIQTYLEHVTDRYNLRSSIAFEVEMTGARFNETQNLWEVRTNHDEVITARYLVTAVGVLSATNIPHFEKLDVFKGEKYHTGAWPEDVELKGKRVGVVGVGSTGTQLITAIAPNVEHLTVFQRRPQYSVPTGNGPMNNAAISDIKEQYGEIWDQVRNSALAFGFEESEVPAMSVSADERERVFQEAWDKGGGFRFMFGTFQDIATDPEANEAAAEFIRRKISEIVDDPETARKLTPTDLYARRPLCDSGYYATFNRDNVTLVDVREATIVEFTPNGVLTSDGLEHELDVMIFATGFDAVDGNFTRLDIRGRNDIELKEHWHSGPTSYLGLGVAGFPNMFTILGPNGPFTNIPPSIETQVEFITDFIRELENQNATTVEVDPEAEARWTELCYEIANETLFPKADSWIFGANIPGKKNAVMFYMGGLAAYREQLSEVLADGYKGYVIQVSDEVNA